MRSAWVGVDAGYSKEPAFLRALDAMGEVFVADVHRDQRVWLADPGLHVPEAKPGRGRPSTKQQAAATPVTVENLVRTFRPEDWTRCAIARAVNCRSISHTGGSGFGMGKRPTHIAGI